MTRPRSLLAVGALAAACLAFTGTADAALVLADGIQTGAGNYNTAALNNQTGTPETGSYDGPWNAGSDPVFGEPAVTATGLTYSDGTNALNVSGGSIEMNRTSSTSTLSKTGTVDPNGTPADVSGSVYFSGLIQLGGANHAWFGIRIGTSGGKSVMGVGVNAAGNAEIRDDGAVIATSAGTTSVSGTVFLVGKITNNGAGSGNDLVTVYINPTLTSEGVNSSATTAAVGTQGWFPSDPLSVLTFEANLVGQQPATYFDEFRIGETWDDVTPSNPIPEPASLALLGLGGLCMLGRSRRVG